MFFEITADGKLILNVHTISMDKEYEYFFDPAEMEYHQSADYPEKLKAI